MKSPRTKTAPMVMLVCLLTACQGLGTSTPGEEARPVETEAPSATSTATPLPTLVEPAAPSAGRSNVYGRIVWNGQPVPGVTMALEGVAYERQDGVVDQRVVTDQEGVFVFRDLPEGYFYALSARLEPDVRPAALRDEQINSDVHQVELPADTNLNVGNYYLFETDLRLLSPEYDQHIDAAAPLLIWQAYEGAVSYRVELKQLYASFTDSSVETSDTQLQLEGPLLACTYGWDVTALDAEGNPIARSDARIEAENSFFSALEANFRAEYDGVFHFAGEGLPACELEVTVPRPGQHFDVDEGWDVSWELHPLAASYRVMVRQTHDENGEPYVDYFFSNEMLVDEDGRPIDPQLPTLPAGQFQTYVIAYAANGASVAQSSIVDFVME
ncbi:MAG: hypothetical protein PVF49_06230 [Anaerolineales bacterium]